MANSELSFFPTPANGETLYSVCARYHHRSGHIDARRTSDELFGFPGANFYSQIPMGLGHLLSVLPFEFSDAEQILRERTIATFYLPLLNSKAKDHFFSTRTTRPEETVFTKIGIPGSIGLTSHVLKCCAHCAQEDEFNVGFTYWHREHQYPGVWICHKHPEILVTPKRNKTDSWIRCPSAGSIHEIRNPLDATAHQHLMHLALLVRWLISYDWLSESSLLALFLQLLEEKTHLSDADQLAQEALTSAQDFLRGIPADFGGTEFSDLRKTSWIKPLIKGAKGNHPLRWMLLLATLDTPIDVLDALVRLVPDNSVSDLFGVSEASSVTNISTLLESNLRQGWDIQTVSRSIGLSKDALKQILETSDTLSRWWEVAKRERRRQQLRSFILGHLEEYPNSTLRDLWSLYPEKLRWIRAHDTYWLNHLSRTGLKMPRQISLF